MSDYSALRDAGSSLRALLVEHITNSGEPGLTGVDVVLASPRELELLNTADVVSLWVHHVQVQPDLANRPAPRVGDDLYGHRPVPIELCVLATPMHSDNGVRHLLAGRLVQVFADHRRVSGTDLVGSLAGTPTELLIGFDSLSAYEMNGLWSSLDTHQRLAVGIRVQGLTIDSHLPAERSTPVLSRTAQTAQIVGAGG